MKQHLFHTKLIWLCLFTLLNGISIQTYAAEDNQQSPKKRTVTGTITSEGDNMPIIGANVWLKNSSTGAITNLDGKYSITIDNSVVGGVLVFSYIGMSTQEIAIENQNVINVTLKYETEKIDEVVVIGYGHQKKASVIGSISTIDMAGVKVPGSSISSVLAGQLAGVVA
ncbi:TonB-dependent receptor [Bacteroides reticulotermitis JCM 10512]|uniref:TonB-dependent receptor n=2 Tax=Bacteroides reticulotermitis TaxID=1133319 RepID=W4UNF7_9BACE|nr:TonB-dependent receptor [Bacteroides reticulotermitis JCM 10512]